MDTATATMRYSNHGLNIRRIREGKRMKQEVLADKAGISQSALSNYENKEQLEDDVIEKIAKALEIPVETIKGATDEAPINIFSGTWNDNAAAYQHYPNFNPIDKVVELYERMLKEKDEKNTSLEKENNELRKRNP